MKRTEHERRVFAEDDLNSPIRLAVRQYYAAHLWSGTAAIHKIEDSGRGRFPRVERGASDQNRCPNP